MSFSAASTAFAKNTSAGDCHRLGRNALEVTDVALQGSIGHDGERTKKEVAQKAPASFGITLSWRYALFADVREGDLLSQHLLRNVAGRSPRELRRIPPRPVVSRQRLDGD